MTTISKECLQWFREHGLYPRDVAGDGNCLFNSLVQLMRGCPEYNREMTQQFREYIVESMEERIKTDLNLRNALIALGNPQKYLDNMKKDGEWGGYIEIVVAAYLLGCRIYIYDYDLWNPEQNNWDHIYQIPENRSRRIQYHLLRIHNNHYLPIFTLNVLETYRRGQNRLCKPPTRQSQTRPRTTRKTVRFSSSSSSSVDPMDPVDPMHQEKKKPTNDLLPGILFLIATVGLGIGLGFGLTK